MTLSQLLSMLADFQDRTPVVRGIAVNDKAIFVSLDSDGSGYLEAYLRVPGEGTPQAVESLVTMAESLVAKADFPSTEILAAILAGEQEAAWTLGDESS